jgi:hypothetical protein
VVVLGYSSRLACSDTSQACQTNSQLPQHQRAPLLSLQVQAFSGPGGGGHDPMLITSSTPGNHDTTSGSATGTATSSSTTASGSTAASSTSVSAIGSGSTASSTASASSSGSQGQSPASSHAPGCFDVQPPKSHNCKQQKGEPVITSWSRLPAWVGLCRDFLDMCSPVCLAFSAKFVRFHSCPPLLPLAAALQTLESVAQSGSRTAVTAGPPAVPVGPPAVVGPSSRALRARPAAHASCCCCTEQPCTVEEQVASDAKLLPHQ